MPDHQKQIIIPAIMESRPMFMSSVILHSLVYDAINVTDNDNFATALTAKIQISFALIGRVKKPSIWLIVLTKQWGIAM